MSEQLGVSRTVLREAMKRLEMQGLVEIRHGSGVWAVDRLHKPLSGSISFLLPNNAKQLQQLCETRIAIEPEVARLAARRATKTKTRNLKKVHQRIVDAETDDQAVEVDIDFHRTLAQMAGNEILKLILESLTDLGRNSRQATIGHVGKDKATVHHERVLVAIEARDEDAAADAMRVHLEEASKDLQKARN